MTKFAKILLLSLLLSFSCEKPQINNGINQQEQVSTGTIKATTTYVGTKMTSAKWCNYYICDINQLDIIMTLTQQSHEACMNGNYTGYEALNNTLGTVVKRLKLYKELFANVI